MYLFGTNFLNDAPELGGYARSFSLANAAQDVMPGHGGFSTASQVVVALGGAEGPVPEQRGHQLDLRRGGDRHGRGHGVAKPVRADRQAERCLGAARDLPIGVAGAYAPTLPCEP